MIAIIQSYYIISSIEVAAACAYNISKKTHQGIAFTRRCLTPISDAELYLLYVFKNNADYEQKNTEVLFFSAFSVKIRYIYKETRVERAIKTERNVPITFVFNTTVPYNNTHSRKQKM